MKYAALLPILFFTAIPVAYGQAAEITMPRDQYIENQLKMMEQLKNVQSDMQDSTQKMMKEKLTPESYAEFQKNQDQSQKQLEKRVATCLGVPVEKMPELSAKVGPDFQVKVIKTCATKLPEIINLNDADWTKNPRFAAYKACAEELVSKETGISSHKLQECSEVAGEL